MTGAAQDNILSFTDESTPIWREIDLGSDPDGDRTMSVVDPQNADVQYSAGGSADQARYVITGLSDADQKTLVDSLALAAERVNPTGTPMKKVRVGLFKPNGSSIDEGWTRWVLEQYGFEYVSLNGLEIQAAPLASHPHRDIAGIAHPADHHCHQPDLVRVQRVPGVHCPVGQQRQQDDRHH